MTTPRLASVINLRAEYRDDALGIATPTPRLSWMVDTNEAGWRQQAYEVALCDPDGAVFDSQHVTSHDSVLIPWPFRPLTSRERVNVRVRTTGPNDITSAWSESLSIEVGLLEHGDWHAVPVTAHLEGIEQERPLRFRRRFTVEDGLRHARLYSSAFGMYAAECNGRPLSNDEVLAPGWTSYDHRLRYRTTDITTQLHIGENAIGFTVAEGWYRGRLGFEGGRREIYGHDTGPIAQLELTYGDGRRDVVATDAQWRASVGPFLYASLYDGERFDARLDVADGPRWSTAEFDDSTWQMVETLASCATRLESPVGQPVRRIDTLRPVSVTTSPSGATLVDFGQNFSGWVRLRAVGPTGTTITLRHAEVLEHGELGTRPLRQAAATDTYVLSGHGIETYEPTFTIHGFRYVEVTGWPGTLTADDVDAVVVHSDMRQTGTFSCSNASLNQLHDNVRWSMRGNFVDIPTDCPQRDERLGWTGDIQVFTPTASFLYDCNGFLASWLADVAAEQSVLGTVPAYVPFIQLKFPSLPFAAWGDAGVIVPWELYARFGDIGVLQKQYASMRMWVDDIVTRLDSDGLWIGMQLGDWLDPSAPPENPAKARTHAGLVAQAYHVRSSRLVARAAHELGAADDETHYGAIADRATAAFVREFVTPSGRLSSDAPTAYALALQFDLLPSADQRRHAALRLADLVARDGYCIGTGFVGTPLICDALADNGYLDDAYLLLLQTRCPSWLYPVSMGATTIWERWDSMLPDGSINPGDMTSFNHYALGAVADFLHRRVAGLESVAPGSRRIRFAPRPGGGLTEAAAVLMTPYGEAKISWQRPGERLIVDVVIPPSTMAVVELPGHAPTEAQPGAHRFECDFRSPTHDPLKPPRRNFLGELEQRT
jgi:alpha-L-rhamnosidase